MRIIRQQLGKFGRKTGFAKPATVRATNDGVTDEKPKVSLLPKYPYPANGTQHTKKNGENVRELEPGWPKQRAIGRDCRLKDIKIDVAEKPAMPLLRAS